MKNVFILIGIFYIAGSATHAQTSVTLEPSSAYQLKLKGDGNGVNWPSLVGLRSNGTSSAPIAVQKDQWLLTVDGSGYNGSGYSNPGGVANTAFLVAADENFTPSANGTYLRFSTITKGTTGVPIERMRINSEGKVGIGSSTPEGLLEVQNNTGTGAYGFLYKSGSVSLGAYISSLGVTGFGTNSNDDFNLTTNGLTRLKIQAGGNVNITGFTKLGGFDAPFIKQLLLTGTTASFQGGTVDIAHGLTPSKILSVSVLVEAFVAFTAKTGYIPSNYTQTFGLEHEYYIEEGFIRVQNVTSKSANILSKPIKILITYQN